MTLCPNPREAAWRPQVVVEEDATVDIGTCCSRLQPHSRTETFDNFVSVAAAQLQKDSSNTVSEGNMDGISLFL